MQIFNAFGFGYAGVGIGAFQAAFDFTLIRAKLSETESGLFQARVRDRVRRFGESHHEKPGGVDVLGGGSNRTESGILEGFGDIARKRRQVDSSPPANVAIFLRWD